MSQKGHTRPKLSEGLSGRDWGRKAASERGYQASDLNHSHVRHYQMQASEFVAFEQALVLGSFGQGRRRGRRNDD